MSEFEMDLFGRFARAEWLLRRWQTRNRRNHGPMGDPHRGQGRILALLKIRPEISQKELAYLLDISPQSLGELLVKMEKSGYITREASEEDRRVMIVKLTEEGAKAAETEWEEEDLFDVLTKKEQKELGEMLDKLIASLEARFEASEEGPSGWRTTWRGGDGEEGSFTVRPDSGPFGRGVGVKGKGGPFGKHGMQFWFGAGGGPGPFGKNDADEQGEKADADDSSDKQD